MRVVVAVGIVWAALLAGCGSSPAAPPANAAYTVAISSAFAPGALESTQSPIILWDAQFVDPGHAADLLIAHVTPDIAPLPAAVWSATNGNVQLSNQEPFILPLPGDPAPTAPPGDTYMQVGSTYGRTTIRVTFGAPVHASATIDAIHFGSLSFGCSFRYLPAWNFDGAAHPVQNLASFTTADLYETAPSATLSPLSDCNSTPLASGSQTVWHVPGGGTLITAATVSQFVNAQPSAWRNDGTTFQPPSTTALLIFKTSGGAIVKALLPVGPYEVTDASGQFAY